MYDAIYEAVHNALLHRELIPVVPVGKEERESKVAAVSRGSSSWSHLRKLQDGTSL